MKQLKVTLKNAEHQNERYCYILGQIDRPYE